MNKPAVLFASVSAVLLCVASAPHAGTLPTTLEVFDIQGNVILDNPLVIALIAIPLLIQSYGIFVIAYAAAWAWRVPQRRQKRALADSDRPHCPQLWTPMLAAADATSRAEASQNAPRAAISMDVGAAPRDR